MFNVECFPNRKPRCKPPGKIQNAESESVSRRFRNFLIASKASSTTLPFFFPEALVLSSTVDLLLSELCQDVPLRLVTTGAVAGYVCLHSVLFYSPYLVRGKI